MRNDTASDFEARYVALTRRQGIGTLTLQAIGTINARCNDFDQNLARPRFWYRCLANSYDIRPAMVFEIGLLHHLHELFALLHLITRINTCLSGGLYEEIDRQHNAHRDHKAFHYVGWHAASRM